MNGLLIIVIVFNVIAVFANSLAALAYVALLQDYSGAGVYSILAIGHAAIAYFLYRSRADLSRSSGSGRID